MTDDRFVAAVGRDATAILELCSRDPTRPIPSCPGWTAADLQQHILDTFRGEIPELGDDERDPAAATTRALTLLSDGRGPARDIAHECAVHRWDAATAFDIDYAFEPDLACDGIDEFFEAAWPLLLDHLDRPAGTGQTLCLRRSDGTDRWRITLGERPVVHHDDQPGDVEVVGSASDLLLWRWGRSEPPDVSGDIRVLENIRNPSGRFLSPGF